jgi:predicted Zn finger-like uncharacterized protein
MFATRCPHCQTRFRVSTEQLQLREGMVRCGSCREVFNAREHIDTPQTTAAAPALAAPDAPPESGGRMTLIDFSAWQGGTPAAPTESNMLDELDALSKAITDLQNKPWREPVGVTPEAEHDWDEDEPGFIQQARKKQRAQRLRKWLLAIGIPVLLLALLAQLTYRFRDEIAVRVPETGPALRAACAQLGCKIALPAQINALTLQSSQLLAVPDQPEHFELVALLRNQSSTPQAWPGLELMLKDEAGQALVRKVFLPADFLPLTADKSLGFAAHSEREVRLAFVLSGPQAADFQLTLFYP